MSSVDTLSVEDYERFVGAIRSGVTSRRTFEIVNKIVNNHPDNVWRMHVDSRCYTVFHYIAENNMTELLSFILNCFKQFNSAVDERDSLNHTPLYIAASLGHLKICEILVEYGSKSLYIPDSDTGEVPLHVAISEKHLDVVSYLIKFTNVYVKSKIDKPIHIAARVGSIMIAEILFEHGAMIESRNSHGARTLLIAMMHAQYEFAKYLINKGADVNVIYPRQGFITSLDYVGNCCDLAELFIQKGASIQNRACGRTSLSCAMNGGHIDVIRVFLRHGAVPDDDDITSTTEISKLDLYKRRRIVRLFLCYGVPLTNRSLRALDLAFVLKLQRDLKKNSPVSSQLSLNFSTLDRLFLYKLASSIALRFPGVAFRLFRIIRRFVTFHGLFMADRFEFD